MRLDLGHTLPPGSLPLPLQLAVIALEPIVLWLGVSAFAYMLLAELRRLGLSKSSWARAQCGTIRLKLLEIGAHVRVSVRRIWISLSSAYPSKSVFLDALSRLRAAPARSLLCRHSLPKRSSTAEVSSLRAPRAAPRPAKPPFNETFVSRDSASVAESRRFCPPGRKDRSSAAW